MLGQVSSDGPTLFRQRNCWQGRFSESGLVLCALVVCSRCKMAAASNGGRGSRWRRACALWGKRIVPSFFGLVLAHSISCVVAVWHMEIVPLLTVEERSSNILLRAMQFAFAGKVLLSGGPVLPGFGSRTATQADPGCNACPRCAMAMICFEVHSATRPFFSCSSPPKNFSPNFFGCLGPGRVASRCTVWTPI